MEGTNDLAARVESLEWYHTMELPGGVVTPGFFDHRAILDRYELPDHLDGQRVLDVGTFDGMFAFEFERRGASEVVALDVPDVEALDWPAPLKRGGTTRFQPKHANFELASAAYGSSVDRRFVSVYDVTPDNVGTFDFVFVGSLLLHLRDPIGALQALLGVCRGAIMIAEESDRWLDLIARHRPYARLQAMSPHLTWWIPNKAALRDMLLAAGFDGVRVGKTFVIPFRGGKGGVRHSVLRAHPYRRSADE